jgi:protein-L-isoaspartate(D-aspartate) O-methyltransferase
MRKNINIQTNTDLIDYLIRKRVLQSKELINAIRQIDRKDFVIDSEKVNAYQNYPLPIGCGQTISQPQTVAFMLELLKLQKGEKVLDLGSGCGRTTALIAKVVGRMGRVYGVEIIPELVKFGQKNLAKYNLPQAQIVEAGEEYGLPEKAPFDKILVSAASDEIPEGLIQQLKIGGKMVIPMQNAIILLEKISDFEFQTSKFKGYFFVPLVNSKDKNKKTRYNLCGL